MAINILSKSTWRSDLAEKLDFCRILKIPLYIVFPAFHVAIDIYKPPFLRAYVLQENNEYKMIELRKTLEIESDKWEEDIIDVSELVPFRLGIIKRKEQKHQGGLSLYRLVLLDPKKDELLLTKNEKTIKEKEKTIQRLEEENKMLKEKLKE